MSVDPMLPLATGSLSVGAFDDPLLVDPDPGLLSAVVAAYREAAPGLVDPDLDALRAAGGTAPADLDGAAAAPEITVFADDRVVDAVTDTFDRASRLAALVEAGVCDLLSLEEPQPTAVLAGSSDGCVLVGAPPDRGDESPPTADAGPWCRLGADPTLRARYASAVETASECRLRTPSRHRVYGAFSDRCDPDTAADVVRLLDADPPPDAVGARVRAYAVGARRRTLDRDLRRACEAAGLGSPSTFTRIKRRLREAGLVGTESVPQPVGRPRERVVAREPLREPSLAAVPDVVRTPFD